MALVPGCIVEFSNKGSNVIIGAVLSLSGKSVRLLLLNGKEINLPEKKVMHATSSSVISGINKENFRQILKETDEKRQNIESEIDITEIHELLSEDIRPYSIKEISDFVFQPDDDNSCAALLRKICAEKIYFKQNKTEFVPATPEELKYAKDQKEKREKQEKANEEFINSLEIAFQSGKMSEIIESKLEDIIKYVAASDDNIDISKKLLSLLSKAGFSDKRKLMKLLVKTGIFKEDENLLLLRYKIPTSYDSLDIQEYLGKINSAKLDNRVNFADKVTWAIDTPGSKDRDDAYSLEQLADGSYNLYIHIADPSEFIEKGSPLDVEASHRGSSIYMPEGIIHMLPSEISESKLSLSEGSHKPALTILMTISNDGALLKYDILQSIISIDVATDYDNADKLSESSEWLQLSLKVAEMLKESREKLGAINIARQPELSVKVIDGVINVEQKVRDLKTSGMIAEFMVWANHVGAKWCAERNIPCVYRTQEKPDIEPELSEKFDPVKFFEALKTFRKTITSMVPGSHGSLGLDGYTQITSPLRRYSDLIIHRQIKSVLNGLPLAYTTDELSNALLISDEAVRRADEIMRERELYFLLKYLKETNFKNNIPLTGTIVDCGLSEVTFYVDFMCCFKHCKKPSFQVTKGQKVGIKINSIDLFDRIIRLALCELT